MHRRILGTSLVLAGVVALAGCAVPPVTTDERADGTTRTLTWADYPGHAYVDADDVLATPDIDDIDEHGHALMDAVQAAVSAEIGIHLELLDSGGEWHEFESNGYASPSLLVSYSCCALVADVVPAEYDDWTRLYDVVARVGAEFGTGPMIREQDQEWVRDDPEQLAEFEKTWATGVDGEYSMLYAWTPSSGQNIMLTIEDSARRLEASDAEKKNEPRISIDYSAVVIERGMRAEFEQRLAAFDGAAKPDATDGD